MSRIVPVCGTEVDPEIDPAALAVAEQLLLELHCPRREKGYTTGHLAVDIPGDDVRTWRRRFEVGEIEGFRRGRDWVTTWPRLVKWVALSQNVISQN